jgi:hypothetical protein
MAVCLPKTEKPQSSAAQLQNRALRCEVLTRRIIDEMSACILKNDDLSDAMKARGVRRRLSDALTGRNRAIRDEIKKNDARIAECVSEALREIDEMKRINGEVLDFINRSLKEVNEITKDCVAEFAACLSRPSEAKSRSCLSSAAKSPKLH